MLQVFDMFSYVQFEGDPQDVPPAHPPPGWKDAFSARHRVAGTMVAYAKAGGQACITYLQYLAMALTTAMVTSCALVLDRSLFCIEGAHWRQTLELKHG